jgi:hypothetical protein
MDQMRLIQIFTVLASLAPLAGYGVEIHGFLLGNYAARTTGDEEKPASGDFLLGEERLQIKLSGSNESGSSYFAKVDFLNDAVTEKTNIDIREAYMSHAVGPFDFTVGRQVFTWGVGDSLFINDVFPKDYVSMFSGRPMEYLKKGTTGFKTAISSRALSADLIIMPFFQSKVLPGSDRFFFYNPFSSVTNIVETRPRHDVATTELAFRLYRPILRWDATLYAYHGFFKDPSMQPDSMTAPTLITMMYPKLDVYGASLQGNALGGVVSIEAGYSDSREDKLGTNPLIPNAQTKFLVGYQRALWTDFTIGLQYYEESMQKYEEYLANAPAGFPTLDRRRTVLTMRLTQLMKYQSLRLSWFSFYSPSDKDYYFIPEVSYRISDELSVALGGNVFGGTKETTFFGQFKRNNNAYVNMRYNF